MPTVYIRTLRRTAELLGGIEPLAAYLKVKPIAVKTWIDGATPVPMEVFLTCVDYLAEHTTKSAGQRDETPGDDLQPRL